MIKFDGFEVLKQMAIDAKKLKIDWKKINPDDLVNDVIYFFRIHQNQTN